jgi:hypothetical protein
VLVAESWYVQNPWFGDLLIPILTFAAGGGLTLWAAWKYAKRTTLDYRVVTDVRVLAPGTSDVRDALSVSVGDQLLKNPRLVVFRFVNTGNQTIDADDFESGITLGSNVSVAHIGAGNPQSGVAPVVAVGAPGSEPRVWAKSINPGEFLEVQYVLDEYAGPVIPIYRINGANRPPRFLNRVRSTRVKLGLRVAAVFGGLLIGLLLANVRAEDNLLVASITGLAAVMVGAMLTYFISQRSDSE